MPAMTEYRLLDLFCCEGGAGEGYRRAGFDVTGVDKENRDYHPGAFVQADAIAYLLEHGHEYDAIHASPPCQAYVQGGLVADQDEHPRLVEPVRIALERVGRPWVIENVQGAPLRRDIVLCGSMFEMPACDKAILAAEGIDVADMPTRPIKRHRIFEFGFWRWSWSSMLPPCCHTRPFVGVYGQPHGKQGAWPGMLPDNLAIWRAAMGMPWASIKGCSEAVPPDYTECIGRELLRALEATALQRVG
jgi:DNA (cytosine-5)-methyltransferase 1